MQIVIIGDDMRKKIVEKEQLEMNIKEMEKDKERLIMETASEKTKMEKVQSEIAQLEAQIKDLKKKINLI